MNMNKTTQAGEPIAVENKNPTVSSHPLIERAKADYQKRFHNGDDKINMIQSLGGPKYALPENITGGHFYGLRGIDLWFRGQDHVACYEFTANGDLQFQGFES
jgi:hypothetical protein